MTARNFASFRPRGRTLTRKLALELWVVGLTSAILLAIALAMSGAAESEAETLGAAGVDAGRLAPAANGELKAFMERAALASFSLSASAGPASQSSLGASAPASVSALSRAAVAPRSAESKARATRVASAIAPPRPAPIAIAPPAPGAPMVSVENGPWRLVEDTRASAVANLVSVSASLSSLAKKFSL